MADSNMIDFEDYSNQAPIDSEDNLDKQEEEMFNQAREKIKSILHTQNKLNTIMGGEDWILRAGTTYVEYHPYVVDNTIKPKVLELSTYTEQQAFQYKDNEVRVDYAVAILDELVSELRPSVYHYKWWAKDKGETDPANALVELIDILHFHASGAIMYESLMCERALYSFGTQNTEYQAKGVYTVIEYLSDLAGYAAVDSGYPHAEDVAAPKFTEAYLAAINSYSTNEFTWSIFFDLVTSAGFSIDQVLDGYLAKATLNLFRMTHGYREGTYKKMWSFPNHPELVEDNAHMYEFINTYKDIDPENRTPSQEEILEFLELTYTQVI